MPNDIAIETSIPHELDEALGRLALATGKSKSSLVCEALTAFVSSEEEFIAAVEAGRVAARAGQLMDHDEVIRHIDGLIAPKR
jgi:predicted transcriptional regulator